MTSRATRQCINLNQDNDFAEKAKVHRKRTNSQHLNINLIAVQVWDMYHNNKQCEQFFVDINA